MAFLRGLLGSAPSATTSATPPLSPPEKPNIPWAEIGRDSLANLENMQTHLQEFIRRVMLNSHGNEYSWNALKAGAPRLVESICEAVATVFKVDKATAENMVQSDPKLLMSIKNLKGQNIIEQIWHPYQVLHEFLQSRQALFRLSHHVQHLSQCVSHPYYKQASKTNELESIRKDAEKAFDQLKEKHPNVFKSLCEKARESDESLLRANLTDLLNHGINPIYATLEEVKEKQVYQVPEQIPVVGIVSADCNPYENGTYGMRKDDSASIRHLVECRAQLLKCLQFLQSNDLDNARTAISQLLDVNLRGEVYKFVWLAHESPNQIDFGQMIVLRDPAILLILLDKSERNLLEQLIEHFEFQISAGRLLRLVENFETRLSKGLENVVKDFNQFREQCFAQEPALAADFFERLYHKIWFWEGGHRNPKFTSDSQYGKHRIEQDPTILIKMASLPSTILDEVAAYFPAHQSHITELKGILQNLKTTSDSESLRRAHETIEWKKQCEQKEEKRRLLTKQLQTDLKNCPPLVREQLLYELDITSIDSLSWLHLSKLTQAAKAPLAWALNECQRQNQNDEVKKLKKLQEILEHPYASEVWKNREFKEQFKTLNPQTHELLYNRVWLQNGGYQNPHFGTPDYGKMQIDQDPAILMKSVGVTFGRVLASSLKNQSLAACDQICRSIDLIPDLLDSPPPVVKDQTAPIVEHFKQVYQKLPQELRNTLAHQVWYWDGGISNPFFEVFRYGEYTIKGNPLCLVDASKRMPLLKEHILILRSLATMPLNTAQTAYHNEIYVPYGETGNVSISALTDPKSPHYISPEEAAAKVQLAMVSAECNGIFSTGGLGRFVADFSKLWPKTRLVMPYYADALPSDVKGKMKVSRKLRLVGAVYRAKLSDTVTAYLIEDLRFAMGKDKDQKPNNPYKFGTPDEMKERWVHFQSAAAELLKQMADRQLITHIQLNDAQTMLIPRLLATRYGQEWRSGHIPPIAATIHNNMEQMWVSAELLGQVGIFENGSLNSLHDGLRAVDVKNTVSKRFAHEIQGPLSRQNEDSILRYAAKANKFFGIRNGMDLSVSLVRDLPKELHFDENTPDLLLKKAKAKKAFFSKVNEHLSQLELSDLGPISIVDKELPELVIQWGRLDFGQKGTDKSLVIAEQVVLNGGIYALVGAEADEPSRIMIELLKQKAKTNGWKGKIIIIDDYNDATGRLHWQVTKGFKSLMLAAADAATFHPFTNLAAMSSKKSKSVAFSSSPPIPAGSMRLKSHQATNKLHSSLKSSRKILPILSN